MPPWNGLIDRLKLKSYGRREPLVLINGLAEQPESWFKNRRVLGRFFDVYVPNILVYDGPAIHDRIAAGELITVDHLVQELHTFITRFVQCGPCHLVASSLGGKIAVEFAAKYPALVRRVVLLCPSGMGDTEQLPIMEGVRGSDWNAVVKSVFYRPRFVDMEIVRYYKAAVSNRRWKTGLLRTVRGTLSHTVRDRMKQIQAPTLLITGANDKICCPKTAEEAAKDLPHGYFRKVAKCGHAPQIEKSRLINKLVVRFLTDPTPSAYPGWTPLLMAKPTRAKK